MDVISTLLLTLWTVLVGFGFGLAGYSDGMSGEFLAAQIIFCLAAITLIVLFAYLLWPGPGATDRLWRAFSLGFVAILSFFLLRVALAWVELRDSTVSVTLWPGSEPDPEGPPSCDPPANALRVYLGSTLAWATSMPYDVIVLGGEKILTINRAGDGSIAIELLRLFDDKNDIIEHVEKDNISRGAGARIEKTKHELIVYDHHDHQALNMQMLNAHSVKVTGIFRDSGYPFPFVITDKEFQLGNITSRSW